MFDGWESIVTLVAAILIAYAVILWLGVVVWTYRDIRERTRDGWSQSVSVLLVLLFNIPGLFLYLILRPRETLTEAYERRLEAEALMREFPEERSACPSCERTVKETFLLCPYCRATLREPCKKCKQLLDLSWIACPICAADGPQTVAAPPIMAQQPAYQSPPGPPPTPQAAPSEVGAPPAPTS
jgi:RNA polymerase subunit RPABC4/transcription elongation factor Spt4